MTAILAEQNVRCPLCGAPPGFPCGNESHPERKQEWDRKSLGKKHHHRDSEEVKILREIEEDLDEIRDELKPRLSYIKIEFGGNMVGPVKLTVGQKTKATVVGFDQAGAPFLGTIPPVTYALDNTALDSSTPDGANGDDIVSLSAGVANLTASLTTAEGTALQDSETITNVAVAQILSSIKIDFSTPA